MKKINRSFGQVILLAGIVTFLCLGSFSVRAENEPQNKLAIITTTDKTELGIAQFLQDELAKAAANTNLFQTYAANYSITAFSEAEILADFQQVGSNIIGFVYLENTRLSIFLFDASRPKEYIVSAQNFITAEGATPVEAEIRASFNTAFQEVISSFVAKQYQALPGSQPESNFIAQEEVYTPQFAQVDVKKLYRELSSLEQKPFYVSANIGMSRFETLSATSTKSFASTVNIGALLGYQFIPALSVELGADAFTHFMLHSELRLHLPIGQKYVACSLSAGGARFMSQPTENLGYAGTNMITQGTIVYGPGFSIDIPLIGLNIRAEGRYYTGKTSVFLGTYGIVYSL